MRLALATVALMVAVGPGWAESLAAPVQACLSPTDWADLGFPDHMPVTSFAEKMASDRCFELKAGLQVFRGLVLNLESDKGKKYRLRCLSSVEVQRDKCLWIYDLED